MFLQQQQFRIQAVSVYYLIMNINSSSEAMMYFTSHYSRIPSCSYFKPCYPVAENIVTIIIPLKHMETYTYNRF